MKKNYRPGEPRTPEEARRREMMTFKRPTTKNRWERRPVPLARKVDPDEIRDFLTNLYGKEQFSF